MFLAMTAATALLTLPLPTPADAQHRDYTARGAEPFWALTIDGSTMRFEARGRRTVTVAAPKPIVGFAGETYRTRRIRANIVHRACRDGMSGRTYPDTVTVTVDGRSYKGCGGEGRVSPLTGSRIEGAWRIESIGGRPAVRGSDPRVTFTAARMSGSTGCNSFSGTFRLAGDRLTPGPLAMTKRACIGVVSAQEQALTRLLDQRLSIGRNRNGKLVLTGRRGETIVLAPVRR